MRTVNQTAQTAAHIAAFAPPAGVEQKKQNKNKKVVRKQYEVMLKKQTKWIFNDHSEQRLFQLLDYIFQSLSLHPDDTKAEMLQKHKLLEALSYFFVSVHNTSFCDYPMLDEHTEPSLNMKEMQQHYKSLISPFGSYVGFKQAYTEAVQVAMNRCNNRLQAEYLENMRRYILLYTDICNWAATC